MCGRFGVLALLPAAESSLPDEPGRLGEPSTAAKSFMEVLRQTGDVAGSAGFVADCRTVVGFAGDVKRVFGTAGLRTDPRPCVDDSRDDLNGDTGFSVAATGCGSLDGLADGPVIDDGASVAVTGRGSFVGLAGGPIDVETNVGSAVVVLCSSALQASCDLVCTMMVFMPSFSDS